MSIRVGKLPGQIYITLNGQRIELHVPPSHADRFVDPAHSQEVAAVAEMGSRAIRVEFETGLQVSVRSRPVPIEAELDYAGENPRFG